MALPDDERLPPPEDIVVPDDLSGLLDGAVGTTDLPSQIGEHGVVSVLAAIDPMPAAPYITEVQPSDDMSISLPYDQAVAYGMAVLAAAHRANYIAAVLAQARDIMGGRRGRAGIGDSAEVDETAKLIMRELLQDLPELDDSATAPLRFLPFIHHDGRPMVRVSLPPHTQAITGWSFLEALDHAHAVLGQAIVSQLDTAYRTVMSVGFDVGEQRGRATVADLGNYFWHRPDPAGFGDPTDGREQVRPAPRKARASGKGKKRKR